MKKPGKPTGATIHYRDIGDYKNQAEKLEILDRSRLSSTEWEIITPNQYHDWIGQRNESYKSLRALVLAGSEEDNKELAPIFKNQTLGLVTSRDFWCYSSSHEKLKANIQKSVDFYNAKVEEFKKTNPKGTAKERADLAKAFAGTTPRDFHWSRENYADLANGETYNVEESEFRVSTYRPFFKQNLYFNRSLNNSIREFPQIYPNADSENLTINLTRAGAVIPFHCLSTNDIPEYHITGDTISIPRWQFVPAEELTLDQGNTESILERMSNINPKAVEQFREHYDDEEIDEDDLFYYTYGVLHSQQWREAFADNLSKSPAHIPMADTGDDFYAFVAAGRELADLHTNYEAVEPYQLLETHGEGFDPSVAGSYSITKMAYLGSGKNQNKSAIVCNSHITLNGIPDQAHQYRLGSRSALDWLIERYQVRTDTNSGITNDPNDWATEHGDPRYIIDLIKRITTVSVRTVEIAQGLPKLPI